MTDEGNHEDMNTIVLLLQKVLPVFLVLFLGMLCRRKSLLTREGINALKKVAVDIALPAVMFSAFATAEYSVQSICVPLTIFSPSQRTGPVWRTISRMAAVATSK